MEAAGYIYKDDGFNIEFIFSHEDNEKEFRSFSSIIDKSLNH